MVEKDWISEWIISNRIIPETDNDDDKLQVSVARQLQEMTKRHKRASKQCEKSKRAYWLSLSTPKRRDGTALVRLDNKENKNNKYGWSMERLMTLSKPKTEHNDYIESCCSSPALQVGFRNKIVTSKNRPPNSSYYKERIIESATPRKAKLEIVKWTRKVVPLSTLMPRINILSRASKRMDAGDDIKTYEESFLVKESSLKYVATERIKRLATPRRSYKN